MPCAPAAGASEARDGEGRAGWPLALVVSGRRLPPFPWSREGCGGDGCESADGWGGFWAGHQKEHQYTTQESLQDEVLNTGKKEET
ncbi:hypothetical protein ABZP36_013264 [Zizania latifolia]